MAKIEFTGKELEYLNDTDFLTTKFSITKKLYGLFVQIENALKPEIDRVRVDLPEAIFKKAGKISKGENYRNLPYMVLDFPRIFSKEDVFSYRVMFWWGHFFSCTLHLGGRSLRNHGQRLLKSLAETSEEAYLCVNDTPWEYHFEADNYRLLSDLPGREIERIVGRPDFAKVSRKMDVGAWLEAPAFSVDTFRLFMGWIS